MSAGKGKAPVRGDTTTQGNRSSNKLEWKIPDGADTIDDNDLPSFKFTIPQGFDRNVLNFTRMPKLGEACMGGTVDKADKTITGRSCTGTLIATYHSPCMVWVTPPEGQEDTFVPCTSDDADQIATWKDEHRPGDIAFGWWWNRKTNQYYKGIGTVKYCRRNGNLLIVDPFSRDDPRHDLNFPPGTWRMLEIERLLYIGDTDQAEELRRKLSEKEEKARQLYKLRLYVVEDTVEDLTLRTKNYTMRKKPLPPRPTGFLEEMMVKKGFGPQ
ncbi:uncharacterized protein DSM5745_10346 [Aspergillus mulundensis]|uniref:Uncharacterized protein n=1 Tax=Aspergillus mulundensis TaxID=1810919 RepID=A0A3D8QN59_9EURO|nr:hypothetical protein DSM5745_10346 [Aspergillus mulundensis]RDW63235.1 hypothetical protein DSM5745_10346 [Aspergillus mulundensis]